ncbi:MAG: shikimate kinase [Candidatus Delongbacteria bacterium]|jgi:shikimate kinase|nr:shikimate kinase [Candidatus Delongbacteria bacterium]
MKIYLTGFMGAGKSTLAKKLAAKLNLPYIDLDNEIERFCGKSIARIFADDGEKAFRKIESRQLVHASKKNDAFVMACGGGILESEQNLFTLQEYGVLVFVDTSIDIIKKRLTEDNEERPLLKNMNNKDRRSFIYGLYENRIARYNKADIKFCPELESTRQLISKINSYL